MESVMSAPEINELSKACQETRIDVAILKEQVGFIKTKLEENKGGYKLWHLVAVTVVYGVINILPHGQIFDFLFK